MLNLSLEDFLEIPREDQVSFLRKYREDEPDEPEWETNPPKILEILSELVRQPDGKTAKDKTPGDKWMSPGRMVCSWPDLDPTARLVLFVMAAHGDNQGGNIYITRQSIATILGIEQARTVRQAWRRLEKVGALTKTKEPRQHYAPHWRINRWKGT